MDPKCVDVTSVLGTNTGQDEDVLLVDIGGGSGHDIMEFHAKQPYVKGRLILQDLPEVVESVKDMPACIKAMAHDFFTPQSIIGMGEIFHLSARN
jgi:hypothetical protein